MANTIAPFDAARLFDERTRVGLPFYRVDPTTKESLMESIEAITKSTRTQEQIAGMLAVVKAQAADMLSDEEKENLFLDVPESDGTPFIIMIEAEGNYGLLYEAWDQLVAQLPEVSETETNTTDEKVTELAAKIAELDALIAENVTILADRDTQIVELTAKIEDPQALENLQSEVTRLAAELAAKDAELTARDETIVTLRGQMAEFFVLKHDSLVSEAARLATELKRAFAAGKGFDELCEALTVRTDESLTDMITDYKLEIGTKTDETTDTTVAGATIVEAVEDPTLQVIPKTEPVVLDPKTSPEQVVEALKQSITVDTASIETYRVGGHLSEAEIAEIFGTQSAE